MTANNRDIIRLLLVAVFTAMAAVVASPSFGAGKGAPALAVVVDDSVKHVKEEPMLLLVTVFNREAANIDTYNKSKASVLKRYKKSDAYKKLTQKQKRRVEKKYKKTPVLVYKLGSKKKSITELISFSVLDSKGKAMDIKARPLAVSREIEESVKLDGSRSVHIYFGIEGKELKKFSPGLYSVVATVDTTKMKGMWRGKASSAPASFEISAAKDGGDIERRLAGAGLYYRLDEQYDKLESVAGRLIELKPESIEGWTHMGDAEDGLGRSREALISFKKALQYYYEDIERRKPKLVEEPMYLDDRIYELEERLGVIIEE